MFTTYMQASQTLRLYAICLQQTRSVYLALVGNPGPISLLHGPNHMPHLAISNGKKNIIFPIEISHLVVYVGIPHFGGETSENHVTTIRVITTWMVNSTISKSQGGVRHHG